MNTDTTQLANAAQTLLDAFAADREVQAAAASLTEDNFLRWLDNNWQRVARRLTN